MLGDLPPREPPPPGRRFFRVQGVCVSDWRPDIERFDDRPGHADEKVTVSERTVLVERLIKAEHRASLAERALRERHPDSAAYITALQAQLAAAERNVDMLLKERAARAA